MSRLRCGLCRTTAAIGAVPAGRLVYFHDHGSPGPGVYLPQGWAHNRARFAPTGTTLVDPERASDVLEPLAPEGLYRGVTSFHCCTEKCREFRADALVQLGYDASGTPILFVPELGAGGLELPVRGTRIERDRIGSLALLSVPTKAILHEDAAPELLH